MDDTQPSTVGRRRRLTAVLGIAGLVGAMAVSGTHPFTLPADLAVGTLIGAAWMLAAVRAADRPARSATAGAAPGGVGARLRGAAPWLGVAAVVVAWELFCYLSAPRGAHPTLSSMADAVDRWRAGKFVLCSVWLALGGSLTARRR